MRCMNSKYTNQPESDIGKWSPESFLADLSVEQGDIVGEQQYLRPFH